MKTVYALTTLGFVAACSDSDPKTYTPLDGAGTTTLASTAAGATLTLDRDADLLTVNGDEGQISADGETVLFASGETMSLLGTDNDYSRGFALSGAEASFGAFGESTARADVPSGTASYSGETIIVATSTDGVFDLTGTVSANVDFSDGDATMMFEDLNGSRATGLSAPDTIDDFGSIVISDISVENAVLTGGSSMVMSGETDTFDDLEGGVNALLFGPEGEELGGSIALSGNAATVRGSFIAAQ
ncbi:hypothetical protein K3729_14930 [Rhodobacteraceae bacterium S2214]|nr:hypothetical protein K3729_14930 [Rhodobacteraceae bacterium S2214]